MLGPAKPLGRVVGGTLGRQPDLLGHLLPRAASRTEPGGTLAPRPALEVPKRLPSPQVALRLRPGFHDHQRTRPDLDGFSEIPQPAETERADCGGVSVGVRRLKGGQHAGALVPRCCCRQTLLSAPTLRVWGPDKQGPSLSRLLMLSDVVGALSTTLRIASDRPRCPVLAACLVGTLSVGHGDREVSDGAITCRALRQHAEGTRPGWGVPSVVARGYGVTRAAGAPPAGWATRPGRSAPS